MNELEKELRKMRVWSKFIHNFNKSWGTCDKALFEKWFKESFWIGLQGAFLFWYTKEGHDYWWKVATKINEIFKTKIDENKN